MIRHLALLVVTLTCFALAAAFIRAEGEKQPTLFRIHLQTQNEGLATTQAFPVFLKNPPDKIMVSTIPSISEYDIETIGEFPARDGRSYGVKVRMTPQGQRKLQITTAEGRGRIMVVFVNGRVVYAPVVNTVIEGGILVIPRGIYQKEIEAFKKWLKKRKAR